MKNKLKLAKFTGYNSADFRDYCFLYDAGNECSLYWDNEKMTAYDELRIFIEKNFLKKPIQAFILMSETSFGIGEEFFSDLFGLDTDEDCQYILDSNVFSNMLDDEINICKELSDIISDTSIFDKAIVNCKSHFFNYIYRMIYDFDSNESEIKDLFRIFFKKEKELSPLCDT